MAVDKFPVEGSHIMMFARSVGDDNQIYYDAAYAKGTEPGGVIAPPTFAQSSAQFDPDYFLRPKPGEDWFGSGKEATGIKKKPSSGGGGGVAVYTPNSTLNTIDTLALVTCSQQRSSKATVGKKKVSAQASLFFLKPSPSTMTKMVS